MSISKIGMLDSSINKLECSVFALQKVSLFFVSWIVCFTLMTPNLEAFSDTMVRKTTPGYVILRYWVMIQTWNVARNDLAMQTRLIDGRGFGVCNSSLCLSIIVRKDRPVFVTQYQKFEKIHLHFIGSNHTLYCCNIMQERGCRTSSSNRATLRKGLLRWERNSSTR